METESTSCGGILTMSLSGQVSAADVDVLVAELDGIQAGPGARVALDVQRLVNLPTAAIGALVDLVRRLEGAGGRMALAGPAAGVRVTLKRLGIAPMVTITDSLDEALELLREQ
jgi:anti-anti-sigma regulatory factor